MKHRQRERGYILLVILLMVALVAVAVAAVLPSIGTQIQRDREEELVHRGKQYVRAIQLYYRKFGRYPASLEQLENTNNLRFLRKRYTDPITGKEEWKLIHFGQAHPKQRPAWMAGGTPASSLGTGIGNPAGPGGATGSSNPAGVSNAGDISKPLGSGQTLGGGPIVGVASTSDKDGLKEIDGKTKYSEWEFVYDPTLDTSFRPGGVPTQPAGPGGIGTGGPSTQPTGNTKPN